MGVFAKSIPKPRFQLPVDLTGVHVERLQLPAALCLQEK